MIVKKTIRHGDWRRRYSPGRPPEFDDAQKQRMADTFVAEKKKWHCVKIQEVIEDFQDIFEKKGSGGQMASKSTIRTIQYLI